MSEIIQHNLYSVSKYLLPLSVQPNLQKEENSPSNTLKKEDFKLMADLLLTQSCFHSIKYNPTEKDWVK